jgi:hypothetical protein
MGIDFRGIRGHLQRQSGLLRLRARLALLNLIRPIVAWLSPQDQKEKFAAEWATLDQEGGEQWKSVHRWRLYTSVGQGLSQWAGMEEVLVAIASLLLRTEEFSKVGIIMYSISFNPWLAIIEDLFSQESRYITLKPKWNNLRKRLMGLKNIRDRLAHDTIYYGDKVATLAGDASLRPSGFDIRQKVKNHQPLDYDQISKFMDSMGKVHEDVIALLNAMPDLLKRETSQQKSSEPTSDQDSPKHVDQ